MAYTRHRKLGLRLIFVPIIGQVAVLLGYAIMGAVTASLMSSASSASTSMAGSLALQPAPPGLAAIQITQAVLGLLGIIAVIGLIFGMPIGLILAGKREILPGSPVDERSGKGQASEIPPEIKGWSWGAFALNLNWALYFHAWLGLLMLVPFVNLVMWIYLSLKGRELAWQAQRWESVDEFKARQRFWDKAGKILLILQLAVFILGIAAAVALPSLVRSRAPSQASTLTNTTDSGSSLMAPEAGSAPVADTAPAATSPSVGSERNLRVWRMNNAEAYKQLPSQGGAPSEKGALLISMDLRPGEYTYMPELATDSKSSENFAVTAYPNDGVYSYDLRTKTNYLVWVPPEGDSVTKIGLVPGDADSFVLINAAGTDVVSLNVRIGKLTAPAR